MSKPGVLDLRAKGIRIVAADLQGPLDDLVKVLENTDVVISTIHYQSLNDEILLSKAAKVAGVSRYVPCFFATVGPRGIMQLRDKASLDTQNVRRHSFTDNISQKEEILDHINRIYLPYTVIDVGWWFQLTLPNIPSGRFDYALLAPSNTILAGGNVPSALTDVRDIGKYVAQVITDPRTLNRKIFVFTETRTQNQIFELVEKMTGEKPLKNEVKHTIRSM